MSIFVEGLNEIEALGIEGLNEIEALNDLCCFRFFFLNVHNDDNHNNDPNLNHSTDLL